MPLAMVGGQNFAKSKLSSDSHCSVLHSSSRVLASNARRTPRTTFTHASSFSGSVAHRTPLVSLLAESERMPPGIPLGAMQPVFLTPSQLPFITFCTSKWVVGSYGYALSLSSSPQTYTSAPLSCRQ